jgi:ATP-dependent RNA helicase RhlE
VGHSDEHPTLLELIKQGDMERGLVFTRTKHGTDREAMKLSREGIDADVIHGSKSQNQRTRTIRNFKSGHL